MNRNFFDSWNVIFDSNNKPLLGKIEFYEPKTTTLKTVYDVDGEELLNPIYVNGRPSTQIMLGEGSYDVKFFEYIGHGDMENDDEFSNWFNYKTEYIVDNSIYNDVTTDVPTVYTIEALQNLANMEDGAVVEVMGYFTNDDCPARYFVWHAEGSRDADGGIIFGSNKTNVGYWEMKIPGSYIDVRWFGDIPSNVTSDTTSNMSQRTKAANAANNYNKDLYFPSTGHTNARSYYTFDGSNTVSVAKDIYCDNKVFFIVKTGTTSTLITCHEFHKCDKFLFTSVNQSTPIGGYKLVANWINSSWFDSTKAEAEGARVGYIIDQLNSDLDFKDTKIKFERDGLNKDNVRFDNCIFVDCYKNISRPTIFANMEFKEEWLSDDISRANISVTKCKLSLDNFYTADTYILFKNKQNDHNYGDLGEQELNNPDVYSGGTLENCFGSVNIKSISGVYELHNASVTLNNLNANVGLNMVDSWITIPTASTVKGMSLRRGSIVGDSILYVNEDCYLTDTAISCEISCSGTLTTLENCDVNKKVTGKYTKVYNCRISAPIHTLPINDVFQFEVVGNNFLVANGYHYVGDDTKTVDSEHTQKVKGIWTNNTAMYNTKHWILIRHFGMSYSGHDYLYMNNANPYFDRMNENRSTLFYGVLIRIDSDHTEKSRMRESIPMITINLADSVVHMYNFKVYGFTIGLYLAPNRVHPWTSQEFSAIDGRYTPNAVLIDNIRYQLPSTMYSSDEFFNYEFKNHNFSLETDINHKYLLGTNVGFTLNDNLDVYDHSLSTWKQDYEGLPMARMYISFKVDQNSSNLVVPEEG